MMMAPNFSPRESGIVINNYFNCEGGVINCNCCKSNLRGRTCTNICLCLKEKLKGDEIKYKDLIRDSFGKINNYALRIRLKLLSNNFRGEIFLNYRHKERFYSVLNKEEMNIKDKTSSYISILFILTADETLWKLSQHSVNSNGFDFSQVHLRQINTEIYALYQTAKTIWTGKKYIKISEIADIDLIDDTGFKTIVNASLLSRYGADVFSIIK